MELDFLFFLSFVIIFTSNANSVKIKTTLGNIKGYYKKSENGRRYAVFEGIPYALPPTGELRFEPPQPPKKWKGDLLATKLSNQCLQYVHKFDTLSGFLVDKSEDCLYLNVYSPEQKKDVLLPVLFWIHGSAFTFGMPNVFGEHYIMDKDVILVTINYRLGPLGFLSTEDDVVPGNMGLKDQSMALKWVHDNIESFGGDPKKITLIGLGTGGASVHYHYFSPLSAGLFQNGISLSGTALNYWANRRNNLDRTKKLGKAVGCSTSDTKELVECLKKSSADSIVKAVKDFKPYLYKPFYPFGPVVEKTKNSPFIDMSPEEKLKKGEVQDLPWITGITSKEGVNIVLELMNADQVFADSPSVHSIEKSAVVNLLDLDDVFPIESKPAHKTQMKETFDIIYYFVKEDIIKSIGDKLFAFDAERAARLQASVNKSPVWFYVYNHKAYDSINSLFSSNKKYEGVSHGDDASLVFKLPYLESTKAKQDQAMRNDLINLWVSFAEKGTQSLTEVWKKVNPSNSDIHFLSIDGPSKFKMTSYKDFGNKEFWTGFYESSFNDYIEKKKTKKDTANDKKDTINDQKDEL